ncbi:MAG: acyl-CoA dehydrogenase family protein [Streptosporangiaceae bacterium]
MTAAPILATAREIADSMLFPAAMEVDAADRVPTAHFDALAAAGLYGLYGPVAAGGQDVDLVTFCAVVEILAGGCLATTFVWLQHHSAVRALAASANRSLRSDWLPALCAGAQRAGIVLGGARPGRPLLRARAVPGGYLFDGIAPWVTGWDLIDVVQVLARDEPGNLIAALLPAEAGAGLAASHLSLVAVKASRTVELRFTEYFVASSLIIGTTSHRDWLARDAAGLRANGSLPVGVAARCARLAGEVVPGGVVPGGVEPPPRQTAGALEAELAAVRAALDAATPQALPSARAAAAEFAFRAAGALVTTAGSRSILVGEHPQRLAREALFLLVFGSRPAIKRSLIGLLTPPA